MVRHQIMSKSVENAAKEIRGNIAKQIGMLCTERVVPGVHLIGDIGYIKPLQMGIYILMATWTNTNTKPWTPEIKNLGMEIFPALSEEELVSQFSLLSNIYGNIQFEKLLKNRKDIAKIVQNHETILDKLKKRDKSGGDVEDDPFRIEQLSFKDSGLSQQFSQSQLG